MWSTEIYLLANTARSAQVHIVIREMCLSQTQRKNSVLNVESLGKNSYLKQQLDVEFEFSELARIHRYLGTDSFLGHRRS
jgi:hypothetical protein